MYGGNELEDGKVDGYMNGKPTYFHPSLTVAWKQSIRQWESRCDIHDALKIEAYSKRSQLRIMY